MPSFAARLTVPNNTTCLVSVPLLLVLTPNHLAFLILPEFSLAIPYDAWFQTQPPQKELEMQAKPVDRIRFVVQCDRRKSETQHEIGWSGCHVTK